MAAQCISMSFNVIWLCMYSLPDHFRMTVDYSEFKRKLLVHGFS